MRYVLYPFRIGLVLALRLFWGPGDDAAAVVYETKRTMVLR